MVFCAEAELVWCQWLHHTEYCLCVLCENVANLQYALFYFSIGNSFLTSCFTVTCNSSLWCLRGSNTPQPDCHNKSVLRLYWNMWCLFLLCKFTCIQSFAAVMRSRLLMVIEQSSHWQHTNGQMGPHPVTYHAVAHLDWVQFATAIQIYFHTILFDYNRWAEAFSWLHSKWHVQCGQYTLWQYTLWIVVLLAMANWHRHDLSSNMWSLLLMRKCASIISSILQWGLEASYA